MKTSEQKNPVLAGKKIGALKDRLADLIVIAQHGGVAIEIAHNDTMIGIGDLIKMVKEKRIDGYLINRSTYYTFTRSIKEKEKYKNISTYLDKLNLTRTEKFNLDTQLVSGMLIKNVRHYEYFRTYFESNWYQIQSCLSYNLNMKENDFKLDQLFTGNIHGLFYPFFYVSLGISGIVMLAGSIYQLVCHLRNRKLYGVSSKNEATSS